jgi:IS30 family transposase
MHYTHFSIEEREKLQYLWWERKSLRQIARELGRSASSISRELKRNFPEQHQVYASRLAHQRALQKRKSRGRHDRLKNQTIRDYVIKELKKRTSPEQIAGRIKIDIPGAKISHEAIYQFIYAQIHRDGYGWLKPGCQDLRSCLRRRKKRRTHQGSRRCQRVLRMPGLSIDVRPSVVNEKARPGDWESDSVASKDNQAGINTLLERKTGLVCITKLQAKTAEATILAIESRMKNLPKVLRQTMTFDNGSENQKWDALQIRTGLTPYFAHAYHFWERGANENVNGLIRDFFPKKTDFKMISEAQLQAVEDNLNNRPRKRLGWLTPREALAKELEKFSINANTINLCSVALAG